MLSLIVMFLKSYWKHILIVIVIASASFYIYHKIYERGYAVATAECSIKVAEYEKKMKVYQEDLDNRIALLVDTSNILVKEATESRKSLKADYAIIMASVKGKPLYIVKEDKCTPSSDFINAYNAAITRISKP